MRRMRLWSDGTVISVCGWARAPEGGFVLYDENDVPTHIDDWRELAVAYPAPNEWKPHDEFWLPGIDWAVESQ